MAKPAVPPDVVRGADSSLPPSSGDHSGWTDDTLLAAFQATGDQGAFAEIASRHGSMVFRVCLRRLGNAHDAEDAAQTVFLQLARTPERARGSLGGWLHKVAGDTAVTLLRARARHARREEEAAMRKVSTQPPIEESLREELDRGIEGLPARLREAVILCYLEGHKQSDAARILGCNQGTLSRWASDGLTQLRALLARRGVAVTSVALLGFFAQQKALAAVPATLLVSLGAAGTGKAAGGAAVLAAQVVSDATKAVVAAKLKVAAGVVLAASVVGAAASLPAIRSALAPQQPTASVFTNPVQLGLHASLGGRRPFPDDNPWNQDISAEPVDADSDRLIAGIGRDKPLFPDFGTVTDRVRAGIPYVVVPGNQPRVAVRFTDYPDESDRGPYPIPLDAPVEGGEGFDESRRLLVLDRDNWKLYELTGARREGAGWRAAGGAVFDLNSNQLRPLGWTSADPAGLPIFAGLVRYDEVVEQKSIRHALRFSCRKTRHAFVAPARHAAGRNTDTNLPPMGMRVRLKADVDLSGFPPAVRVVLQTLKTHGMFLANHGSDWYLSGTSDSRWEGIDWKSLQRIKGKDLEVVKMARTQATDR